MNKINDKNDKSSLDNKVEEDDDLFYSQIYQDLINDNVDDDGDYTYDEV